MRRYRQLSAMNTHTFSLISSLQSHWYMGMPIVECIPSQFKRMKCGLVYGPTENMKWQIFKYVARGVCVCLRIFGTKTILLEMDQTIGPKTH